MPRGPMAKHPSVRQRRNTASTSRSIVLSSEILPVPDLPVRRRKDNDGELVEAEWHDQVKVAWADMWQYPIVYEAPPVDRQQHYVYIALLQDFWDRSEAGRPINEVARDIRAYQEVMGIGEKARRHLQITIEQAEDAIARGRRREIKVVESSAEEEYLPSWSDADEDDGSIADAEVVA